MNVEMVIEFKDDSIKIFLSWLDVCSTTIHGDWTYDFGNISVNYLTTQMVMAKLLFKILINDRLNFGTLVY